MTKKNVYTVIIHTVCWVLVALPVFIFAPEHARQTVVLDVLRLFFPLFLCAIFYLNYLWLVPKFFVEKQFAAYACINLVVILFISLCMNWVMEYIHFMEFNAGLPPPPPRFIRDSQGVEVLFGFIKDMFPFVLSAVLGTSLCLSMRWHDAEALRKEMEIQKTKSELDNLRSQINPHFLLNTLNNIYALIAFDKDKAQKAVLSLSLLLRQMLYGGRNNLTTLREEVELLRNYVELMQLRLNKNVKIDFSVDIPVDRDVNVAPFIFISLVENAFKHGVSPIKPSFISIRITSDGKEIVCEIRNSNYPKADTDKSGHGIGLEQVARRLALAYAGKYEWDRGVDEETETYYSKITIYDTDLCDNR